jgi:hypothetical protein
LWALVGGGEVFERFDSEAEEAEARARKEKYKWVPFINPNSEKRLLW